MRSLERNGSRSLNRGAHDIDRQPNLYHLGIGRPLRLESGWLIICPKVARTQRPRTLLATLRQMRVILLNKKTPCCSGYQTIQPRCRTYGERFRQSALPAGWSASARSGCCVIRADLGPQHRPETRLSLLNGYSGVSGVQG